MRKTARELNREEAGGAPAFVLGVPLMDDRQMYYLRNLAALGYGGETPEEVAAMFITEGILAVAKCPAVEDLGMRPPKSWKGFKP
jgi:hypothetical protein